MSLVSRKAYNHPQQTGRRGADDSVDDRATPWEVFDTFHREFEFSIDAAASPANARLPRYWTREDDALAQSWAGERVWCNPPYSAVEPWVRKAWDETEAEVIAMLLPANRTEQGWWQRLVEPHRDRSEQFKVRFLPGRLRFVNPEREQQHVDLFGERESLGVPPNSRPPFGVCLLIWFHVERCPSD